LNAPTPERTGSRLSSQRLARWIGRKGALAAITAVWLLGLGAMVATVPPEPVVVTHWANGHMMDRETLLPAFAREFTEAGHTTVGGRKIRVEPVRANSGEISAEIKERVLYGAPIDRKKADPVLVTPAADHWVVDLNHLLGRTVLEGSGAHPLASTYIGIVTSREMAECLGWPEKAIGFADIIDLASDANGWSRYTCAKTEWGREALLAFTYPSRSSTARSVLYTLYSIAAGKPAETLNLTDVSNPGVTLYVNRFQSAVDCYVPDTLDLNIKILSAPSCAHFYFIAEDNLVKLYQGKVSVPVGTATVAKTLERDLVMIHPKEGAIIHNHSAFLIDADFVSTDQADAARLWIDFLREEDQQRAFMQEGFRRVTSGTCVDPVGSPFSPCARTPGNPIYPDKIDPAVAAAILDAWE
jgi:Ca-activated chloride channel homolog